MDFAPVPARRPDENQHTARWLWVRSPCPVFVDNPSPPPAYAVARCGHSPATARARCPTRSLHRRVPHPPHPLPSDFHSKQNAPRPDDRECLSGCSGRWRSCATPASLWHRRCARRSSGHSFPERLPVYPWPRSHRRPAACPAEACSTPVPKFPRDSACCLPGQDRVISRPGSHPSQVEG